MTQASHPIGASHQDFRFLVRLGELDGIEGGGGFELAVSFDSVYYGGGVGGESIGGVEGGDIEIPSLETVVSLAAVLAASLFADDALDIDLTKGYESSSFAAPSFETASATVFVFARNGNGGGQL